MCPIGLRVAALRVESYQWSLLSWPIAILRIRVRVNLIAQFVRVVVPPINSLGTAQVARWRWIFWSMSRAVISSTVHFDTVVLEPIELESLMIVECKRAEQLVCWTFRDNKCVALS